MIAIRLHFLAASSALFVLPSEPSPAIRMRIHNVCIRITATQKHVHNSFWDKDNIFLCTDVISFLCLLFVGFVLTHHSYEKGAYLPTSELRCRFLYLVDLRIEYPLRDGGCCAYVYVTRHEWSTRDIQANV